MKAFIRQERERTTMNHLSLLFTFYFAIDSVRACLTRHPPIELKLPADVYRLKKRQKISFIAVKLTISQRLLGKEASNWGD